MTTGKKFISGLLTFGVLFITIITFFPTAASTQPQEKEGWPKKIVIGVVGGETSASYPWLSGLGKMIEKYLGVSVNVTSTSGHDSTNMLYKGQLHIIFPGAQSVADMLRGLGPTKAWGPTPARAWLQTQLVGVDFIVLDKSGIKTFKDFEGKIVCVGPRAAPTSDFVMNALSAAYGFDLKKVRIVKWDRPSEAYDGLKANRFDVIQVQGIHPLASNTELFMSSPGHILEIDDVHMAKIRKELPWTINDMIPAGTYKGMSKNVQTLAVPMFLVTHRDVPESFVYTMTKMVWEHFDEFSTYHPSTKRFKASDVTKIVDLCPYHKGAIKYYREIGVWTKDLDKRQDAILSSLPESVR